MSVYFLRKKPKTSDTYLVTKFDEGHAEPIDTYHTNPVQIACSCPAYKPFCKHVKMLQEWILQGSPDVFYDDKTNKFILNPFTQTAYMEELLDDKS